MDVISGWDPGQRVTVSYDVRAGLRGVRGTSAVSGDNQPLPDAEPGIPTKSVGARQLAHTHPVMRGNADECITQPNDVGAAHPGTDRRDGGASSTWSRSPRAGIMAVAGEMGVLSPSPADLVMGFVLPSMHGRRRGLLGISRMMVRSSGDAFQIRLPEKPSGAMGDPPWSTPGGITALKQGSEEATIGVQPTSRRNA